MVAEDINTSPVRKYGNLLHSSAVKSVSSCMVCISDALTVLNISLLFNWAVMVSSNKVGL